MLDPKTIDRRRAQQMIATIDPEMARLTARLDQLSRKRAPYAAALEIQDPPRHRYRLTPLGWVVALVPTLILGTLLAVQIVT